MNDILERLYEHFFQQHGDSVRNEAFIEMFQFINIKSYTEAYCESVGSLMNILVEKGRNLTSANFSKELQLSFNAPPLHILSEKVIPDIAKELRKSHEFSRKLEQTQEYKLKYKNLSASLGNLRKQETERAHLPISFFKK